VFNDSCVAGAEAEINMHKEINFSPLNLINILLRSKQCAICQSTMKIVWDSEKIENGWQKGRFLEWEWSSSDRENKTAGFSCSQCEVVVKPSSQPFRWSR